MKRRVVLTYMTSFSRLHNMAAGMVRRETSWRRRWKEDLKSQPWKPFTVSCYTYLVKTMFVEQDCSYEICLCDLNTLWYEKVEHDHLKTRVKVSVQMHFSVTCHLFTSH